MPDDCNGLEKSWKNLKIDFVAPPFGGHLYPLLEIASFLHQQDMENIRVLSTSDAAPAISLCGLEGIFLLPGKEAAISAIANPPHQVKSNPLRLSQQFSANLALMRDLKAQLQAIWQVNPPDLVIADFTLPITGILAEEMGQCWWTSTPTLCAIETKTGTPAYLGGWMPGQDVFSQFRDFLGRSLIHGFKVGIGWWFREELRSLNFPSIYRQNGAERIYSPIKILGLGMREFEFERDWPVALQFVGPLTASPLFPHVSPQFQPNVHHVLVSLGTHIPWAKQQAAQFIQQVACQMPEVHFHFSYGNANEQEQELPDNPPENAFFYSYLPYDLYMHHFDAAIIHGGTGLLYRCIQTGVPMLVWPHDYDQFDHAARIVHRGLGLRFKPDLNHTIQSLQQLFSDESIAHQMAHFQELLHQYDAKATILNLIQQFAETDFHRQIRAGE